MGKLFNDEGIESVSRSNDELAEKKNTTTANVKKSKQSKKKLGAPTKTKPRIKHHHFQNAPMLILDNAMDDT